MPDKRAGPPSPPSPAPLAFSRLAGIRLKPRIGVTGGDRGEIRICAWKKVKERHRSYVRPRAPPRFLRGVPWKESYRLSSAEAITRSTLYAFLKIVRHVEAREGGGRGREDDAEIARDTAAPAALLT
ncbi:hypothetical protein KM043_005168 [Ampulex compressa]|nr:hypothetical protein KM043_005168 [Ampulex compressa]